VWYQDTMQAVPQVGVDETLGAASLAIYPNPASELACLEFELAKAEKMDIRISDLSGKQLVFLPVQGLPGLNKQVFDLRGYAPGVYFVQLSTANATAVKKLIITR